MCGAGRYDGAGASPPCRREALRPKGRRTGRSSRWARKALHEQKTAQIRSTLTLDIEGRPSRIGFLATLRFENQPTHLNVLVTVIGGNVNVASIWTLSPDPLLIRRTSNVPPPAPPASVKRCWRLTTYSVPFVLEPVPWKFEWTRSVPSASRCVTECPSKFSVISPSSGAQGFGLVIVNVKRSFATTSAAAGDATRSDAMTSVPTAMARARIDRGCRPIRITLPAAPLRS